MKEIFTVLKWGATLRRHFCVSQHQSASQRPRGLGNKIFLNLNILSTYVSCHINAICNVVPLAAHSTSSSIAKREPAKSMLVVQLQSLLGALLRA
eukprot:2759705-Amphidinium_carterae.1